ncbi:MAG: hypothetical protein K2J60_14050, partial [Acetatifactor sp.]|nr:hypothetical protein [Acetatifactor sp.]
MKIMKKKFVMIAVVTAAVLVIETAGCGSSTPSGGRGSSTPSGGRGSKYEENSGPESRQEGAAGEKVAKQEQGIS